MRALPELRLRRSTDPERWDALVSSLPGGTAFHERSWLELQADTFGWHFIPLEVLADGEAVGVVPILLRSRVTRRSATPPFPFVGPLVPEPLLRGALRELRRWQARHGAPHIRLDFGPDAPAATAEDLAAAGYGWRPERTFVIELAGRTADDLRRAMNRNTRRSVDAAAEKGVTVRPARPGDVSALLPRILDEAYGGRGIAPAYPHSIGERIERWRGDREEVYARVALVGGEPAGMLVALGGRPVVMGWAGGCLRAYRHANPNTVLHFDLLNWALDRGNTALDLVGYVDEGVSRFKRSLGATESPYLSATSSLIPRAGLALLARLGGS
jgi:hypothetical protein